MGLAMTDDEFVEEAILAWDEAAEGGSDLSPAELTRERPHLVERVAGEIAKLRAVRQWRTASPTRSVDPPTGAFEGCRFRPTRFVASGGLGDVYAALDVEFDRNVALKRIRPDRLSDPRVQSRFLREATLTARLEHPGIAPVYGKGRDADGGPFYAMRFLAGRTLKDAVRDLHAMADGGAKRLAFRDMLRKLLQASEALEFAHDRGVVHRDVKPGNILLGEFGEVVVLDWGLAREQAKLRGDEQGTGADLKDPMQTMEGQLLGTPAYMSPEQAAGRISEIGIASDVYGLGAVLYEVLAGAPPSPARARL
jgi:serine/threonine protein kinase